MVGQNMTKLYHYKLFIIILILMTFACGEKSEKNNSNIATPKSSINYNSIKAFFSGKSSGSTSGGSETKVMEKSGKAEPEKKENAEQNLPAETSSGEAESISAENSKNISQQTVHQGIPKLKHTPKNDAAEYYRKGLKELERKNYKQSVNFFNMAHDADYLFLEPLEGIEKVYLAEENFEKLRYYQDYLINVIFPAFYGECVLEIEPPLFKNELYSRAKYDSMSLDDKSAFDRKFGYIGTSIDYMRTIPIFYWSVAKYYESEFLESGRQVDAKKRDFFFEKAIDLSQHYIDKYSARGFAPNTFIPHLLESQIKSYMGLQDYKNASKKCEQYKQQFKKEYTEYQIDYYYYDVIREKLK